MFAFPHATHSHSPFGHSHRAQHPHAYSPFGSTSYRCPSSSRHASVDPYLAQELAEREALRELQQERRRSIELARRRQQQQEEQEEQARQEFAYRQYVKQQLAREQAQIEEEERYRRAVLALQEEQRARQEQQARQHFIAQQQQRQQQIAHAHARAHAQQQAQQQKQRQIEAQQQQDESEEDLNDFLMANPFFQFLNQLSGQQHSAPAQERSTQQPTPAPTRAAEPTQAPAPVAPSNPSPPTEALESAATTLQTAYRHRLARRSNLDKLAALTAELSTAESQFELPDTLDLHTRNPVKLAFTPHNAPFLAFEDSLVKLLTKVDEVVSGGDREVKKARKTLVGKIEEQLARLDAHKEALAKQVTEKGPESTEAATASADAEEPAIETDTATEDSRAPATSQAEDTATPTDTTTHSTEPPAAEEDAHSDCETESTLSVDSIDAWDVVDDLIKQTVTAAEEEANGPTKDPKPLASVQEPEEEEEGVLEDLFAQ